MNQPTSSAAQLVAKLQQVQAANRQGQMRKEKEQRIITKALASK